MERRSGRIRNTRNPIHKATARRTGHRNRQTGLHDLRNYHPPPQSNEEALGHSIPLPRFYALVGASGSSYTTPYNGTAVDIPQESKGGKGSDFRGAARQRLDINPAD